MKRIFLTAAMLLAALLLVLLLRGGTAPAPSPAPSVAVQTITLHETTTPSLVEAYGSVMAGPAARDILLPAPGIIARLAVLPGDAVTAGQLLARITPDAQSAADLRKAQDAVTAAQAARTHAASLLSSHLATTADLASADQTLHDAQAQLAALAQNGTGSARDILAPAAGVIMQVLVPQGSFQPAGASLFRLAGGAHPAAQLGVPEAEAASIQPGAPARLTLLNSGASLDANVVSRAAALDPQTGLITITLALDGAAPVGEPVRAALQAGLLTGYAVPRDAVQSDENGTYIFQEGTDHLAHRTAVQVLGEAGAETILAPGLNEKQPLITSGAYQLQDGMAVRAAAQN